MKYPLGSPQAMKLEKSLVDPTYWDPPEENCAKCGNWFLVDEVNNDGYCKKCEPKDQQ